MSNGRRPDGFNRPVVEAVLRGDTYRLPGAFVWANTEQGHKFWSDQMVAGFLSAQGRELIEAMLRDADQAGEKEPTE